MRNPTLCCLLLLLFSPFLSVAGDTWETSNERWLEVSSGGNSQPNYPYDNLQPDWTNAVMTHNSSYTYVSDAVSRTFNFYYCSDSGVKYAHGSGSNVHVVKTSQDWSMYQANIGRTCNPDECPGGGKRDDITGDCPPPCESEKQALVDQCGQQTVDWSNWSDETCSGGSCSGCSDPGDEFWQNTCIPKCDDDEFRDEFGQCHHQPTCKEAAISDQTLCTIGCQAQGMEEGIYSCVQTPGGVSEDCRCTDLRDMPFEKMAIPDPSGQSSPGGESAIGNGTSEQPSPSTPTESTTETPSDTPSEKPTEAPDSEEAKWLKPIKEDLGKITKLLGDLSKDSKIDNKNDIEKIKALNGIGNGISNVTGNQVIMSKQLGAIATNTGTAVKGIGAIVDGIADLEDAIEDGLDVDVDVPSTITLEADTTDLGVDNVYDTELEPLEEDTFFAMVGDYVSSNVPVLNYIQGSKLSVTGSNSTLSCFIWGKTIQADISPYKGLLNKAGLVLVFVASVISFQIVVARVA